MNKPAIGIKIVDMKEFQEFIENTKAEIENAKATKAEIAKCKPSELLVRQMQLLAEKSIVADEKTLAELSHAMRDIYTALTAY